MCALSVAVPAQSRPRECSITEILPPETVNALLVTQLPRLPVWLTEKSPMTPEFGVEEFWTV